MSEAISGTDVPQGAVQMVVLTWAVLFLAPITASMLILILSKASRASIKYACYAATALIGIVTLCTLVGLQTTSSVINFILLLAAFSAYWVLAAAAWTIRPRGFGILLGCLAYLPLVPTILVGTVGGLGLTFIVVEAVQSPREQRLVDAGLTCRVTAWGAAMTDSGYEVSLYRPLPWLPFLHLKVATASVNESNPGKGPASASCESVTADGHQRHPRDRAGSQ